jgi:hypothetical protein
MSCWEARHPNRLSNPGASVVKNRCMGVGGLAESPRNVATSILPGGVRLAMCPSVAFSSSSLKYLFSDACMHLWARGQHSNATSARDLVTQAKTGHMLASWLRLVTASRVANFVNLGSWCCE